MLDHHRITADAIEPLGDLLRVGDTAGKEQQLGLGWREGDGDLVVETAVEVADHLIFIND